MLNGILLISLIYKQVNEKLSHDNHYKPLKSFSAMKRCEFIWDCEYTMNCCDFVLFKICCDEPSRGLIPIPIPLF
jgi:hypothetical protein